MGGNAFANVKPIKKEHIETTVNAIVSAFPIPRDYCVLGSAGKKPVSGDIDIAVNITNADEQTALYQAAKQIINDHDVRKFGYNMISFPWPVAETGEHVQVDFVFGDPNWLNFFYHAPSAEESSLKGTHRNTAISAVASLTDYEPLSSDTNDDGACVDAIRWKWSNKTGLSKVRRYYPLRKVGQTARPSTTGYVKTSKEEVLEGGYFEPAEVANVLFRGQLDDKYLTSAEKVIEAVGIVYNADDKTREAIYAKMAKYFLEHHDLKTKAWDYPPEIKRYITPH